MTSDPLPEPGARIDKWLWAVRLFKTRSQATEACRGGHVKVGGETVKPARTVRVGDVLQVQTDLLTRTVKVIGSPLHRVGAKLVSQFLEDLTPPSEYEKRRAPVAQPLFTWEKGRGRPTKRDRRALDEFFGDHGSD